jgi:hypothetical protein
LLREVLAGPLVFTPTATGYHFRAPVVTEALIAGAVEEGVFPTGGVPDGNSMEGCALEGRDARPRIAFGALSSSE